MECTLPTVVIFACRVCGAVFRANQFRAQTRSSGRFECTECNEVVWQWAGLYAYIDWQRS